MDQIIKPQLVREMIRLVFNGNNAGVDNDGEDEKYKEIEAMFIRKIWVDKPNNKEDRNEFR